MIPQSPAIENRRKVLVTGATGLLGSHLVPALASQGWDVASVARSGAVSQPVDLCDAAAIQALVAELAPCAVVHLAAETDVDLCERDPQLAYRQNALAAFNLARACARLPLPPVLVHASTDHVYDGAGLHGEEEVTTRNHYAMSKIAGEHAALRCPGATVLRLNFVGRSRHPRRSSFSDWVVASLRGGQAFQVFEDVWFSPLRIESLVRALAHVLARPVPGVFNLGARGEITKAALASRLADGLKLDGGRMSPVPVATRPGMAPRPRGMGMDCSRFEAAFSLALPTIEDEVQALLQEYINDLRP